MNINQVLTAAIKKLSHLENPKLEAEVLLAALLEQNRTWLKTNTDFELSAKQEAQYSHWINQRASHHPSAYIIGHVIWNDLKIKVTPDTLIPRDETETLCHHLKEQQSDEPNTILDVGTGSGCLALWCKKNFPNAQVTALDISNAALAVAKQNAQTLNLKLDFKHSDLLTNLEDQSHYDLIIANLPYVPKTLTVTPEVETEPQSAIFSDDDGLAHIKQLAQELKDKPITFTQLWLEFLPSQAEAITQIFADFNVVPFTAVDGQIFFAQIKPHV